jgi:signal transduction histidine kinase
VKPRITRPILAIVLLALGVIAAVWTVTLERLRYDHDKAFADASRDAANLALGLEEHVARTLRNISQTLAFVRHEYLREGRSLNIFNLIEDGADAGVIASINVIDKNGDVLIGRKRGQNLTSQDFFRIHAERNDDQLFIGSPALDEATGKWGLELSRRIRGPDALFAGVVAVTIDPARLTRFYQHAGLGGQSAVTVAGLDGVSRIRQIGQTFNYGDDMRGRGMIAEISRRPMGTFLSKGNVDGIPRFVSYRTLPQFPLIVSMGIPKDEALAPFEKQRRDYYVFAFLTSVFIATLAAGLLVAMARRRRELDSLLESESRLRRSELQLRDITNAVPMMIAYFDADRRIRFHNTTYDDWLGPDGDDVHGGDSEKIDEVLRGYPAHYERSQKNARGELRDLDVHYFPRYDGAGAQARVIGYYAVLTDITEFKRIDRMKSEFVSTVSHELRTPLTSIRGSLGLIAGGIAGRLPEAAASLVEIAKNNCERLIRLINDILDTETIESGKMRFDLQVVQLEPLIRQALASNEGFAAQHKVRFELRAPDQPTWVRTDADRLSQVVTNLLSNAVKFSPAGAAVEVAIETREDRVRVEVRDHGSGIPEEFHTRIFQKFSQADSSDTRQSGGTGLGLNISKAIVERLGGSLGFTTDIGHGTMFFFELPRCARTPGADVLDAAGPIDEAVVLQPAAAA